MSQVFDILVVEDDRFWHGALGRMLAPHRVHFAQTVAEARLLLAARSYDGYVIDVKLRGYLVTRCGLELLEWARSRGLDAPALVITASDSREHANRAQKLGAALVYKPDVQANIARLLTDIAETRRAPGLSAQASDFARLHGLTPRQRQLVLGVARGVPNGELAASMGITGDALKALVRRTLRKTGAASCDQLLRAIARHGVTDEQERARASKSEQERARASKSDAHRGPR